MLLIERIVVQGWPVAQAVTAHFRVLKRLTGDDGTPKIALPILCRSSITLTTC